MMKKAMSYIWPMTKKIKTVHSGILEITWLNGKKILDSKNANYSYGSLEKVLDLGLSYCKAERSSEVLVLGLGGGSVLGLLRKKYKFYGKITAVEIDPAVIDIALSEFNINQHEPLELLCEDAFEYVQGSKKVYGLIIVDIFIDVQVPEQFFYEVFWNNISRLLEKNGEVIFNTGINAANRHETERVQNELSSIAFRKMNVRGTNTLLLGIKK